MCCCCTAAKGRSACVGCRGSGSRPHRDDPQSAIWGCGRDYTVQRSGKFAAAESTCLPSQSAIASWQNLPWPARGVALRLAEMYVAAGWPSGLFNVVTGDNERPRSHWRLTPTLQRSRSPGAQRREMILSRAAGARKFLAELGSNAANIVFSDADSRLAASSIASAGFEASGQQCISAQRVLVDRSVLDEFLPAVRQSSARR